MMMIELQITFTAFEKNDKSIFKSSGNSETLVHKTLLMNVVGLFNGNIFFKTCMYECVALKKYKYISLAKFRLIQTEARQT